MVHLAEPSVKLKSYFKFEIKGPLVEDRFLTISAVFYEGTINIRFLFNNLELYFFKNALLLSKRINGHYKIVA